jgi:homoserine kinase type II
VAVFTTVQRDKALAFASLYYPDAEVVLLQGIAAGIENTNYFLDVATGGQRVALVLTLFETLASSDLAPVIAFVQHLSGRGLPVPAPLKMADGESFTLLNGRPAVLVPRVDGSSLADPQPADCFQVAAALAAIHEAAASFPQNRPLLRNQDWLNVTLAVLKPCLPESAYESLRLEIELQQQIAPAWQLLPCGWGHQDLFRDNVLISQGKLSGIIDFYHACEDAFIVDLAIMINDWCLGELLECYAQARLEAVMAGYQSVRRLQKNELSLLPKAMRLAALRFWLSRSRTWYQGGYQNAVKRGEVRKDPREMQRINRLAAALPENFFH